MTMRAPLMKYAFAKYAVAGALALSLAAGGAVVAQAALTQNPAEVRAGDYALESSHGKSVWYRSLLCFVRPSWLESIP